MPEFSFNDFYENPQIIFNVVNNIIDLKDSYEIPDVHSESMLLDEHMNATVQKNKSNCLRFLANFQPLTSIDDITNNLSNLVTSIGDKNKKTELILQKYQVRLERCINLNLKYKMIKLVHSVYSLTNKVLSFSSDSDKNNWSSIENEILRIFEIGSRLLPTTMKKHFLSDCCILTPNQPFKNSNELTYFSTHSFVECPRNQKLTHLIFNRCFLALSVIRSVFYRCLLSFLSDNTHSQKDLIIKYSELFSTLKSHELYNSWFQASLFNYAQLINKIVLVKASETFPIQKQIKKDKDFDLSIFNIANIKEKVIGIHENLWKKDAPKQVIDFKIKPIISIIRN